MASANVVELTSANWENEVVNSQVPVMVDFWAPWCGPCRMLAPTIDRIADQFSGRIKVGKLNTDDNQDVAVRYAISGIPQLLFFQGGDKSGGSRPPLANIQGRNDFPLRRRRFVLCRSRGTGRPAGVPRCDVRSLLM
ncbi:MAG: thioredoxin [Planctomycetes bacterium]|nr:thioredoxin [Planctomycetota bacterium]